MPLKKETEQKPFFRRTLASPKFDLAVNRGLRFEAVLEWKWFHS